MAIRKIARMGHPVLRQVAAPIADPTDPEVARLARDLVDTCEDIGGNGIAATGLSAEAYARDLLETHGVAVMPGTAFGTSLEGWVRVALTVDDAEFSRAADRIVVHANTLATTGATA